jgi:Bifunctional DNA primase/polymerase, N-terminal
MTQLTKFQQIALPLVRRGFPVTPVRPDAKAGAAGKWNRWQYQTEEQVLTKYVEKYASCNGGVVGMRGVGNLCFLDDDGGVPKDIISRLPRTYTVATRPDSSHRHFYFEQMPYSVLKYSPNSKTINIRDTQNIVPAPSGGLMYKTLFDMKGIGGASLVVAAGSTKPNGDVYTCIDDGEVAEIPEWLVDWVLEQQRAYKISLNRIQRDNLKQKRRAAKLSPEVREKLRALGHPDGFDIFPVDRKSFIQSEAFKLTRLGLVGEPLVNHLIEQVCKHVEGGTTYCQTEHARNSIWVIACHAEKATEDGRNKEIADFYTGTPDAIKIGTILYGELPDPSRRDVLRSIIHEFPDRLTCDEADKLLCEGLELAKLAPYDKRKDKNALTLIRGEAQFRVGTTFWERTKPRERDEEDALLSGISLPLPYTGEGTGQSLCPSTCEGTLSGNLNTAGELIP